MSLSPSGSEVYSSSGEEEEEEMTATSKKPAVTAAAAPPRKPSTTTVKSPSKSLSRIPSPQPSDRDKKGKIISPSNPESSEEEDDSGEESTDEDSASDDTVAAAVAVTKPSDSDDSGSDTESSDQRFEIRHSSYTPDPSIKPLASKPMDEPAHSRKPASHRKLLTDLKASPELPHTRQPLMWSKDDELALLSGLADYTRKKGSVPTAAVMDGFHVSTQKSLGIDVSKTQLSDKIRRLKKKYLGSDSSSKSVDQDVIKLCNQIWGRGGNSVKSENVKAEKYVEDEVTVKRQKTEDEHDSVDSIPEEASDHDNLLADQHSRTLLRELVLKTATKQIASAAGEAVEMVDGAKVEELVGRHKKLALLEMKSNLRRMALMQESVKLFMEALEKLV